MGILSGNALCRNPRVLKEAACLAEAGHAVEVLGAWLHPRLRAEDLRILENAAFRFTPVFDAANESSGARLAWMLSRLLTRLSRGGRRKIGIENRWQLGPVVGALGRAARARTFDLAIAHSEPALSVVSDLEKRGRRIGIDFEDWFSEDLLPAARRSRPVNLLRRLEQRAVLRGVHASCPTRAMSEALAAEYGCAPPAVVYNAFPWSDRKAMDGLSRDRAGGRRPTVHWYSQTLGEGRGLEDLLAALPLLRSEVEVHLRGEPAEGFGPWLASRLPEAWRERVVVHPLVANSELLSRMSEHDIGFAGEMKYCRNKNLTASNKVLHYLLAGLAVVASDTVGQMEIAAQAPGAMTLYPSGDPGALAQRVDELLIPEGRLGGAKSAALAAAEGTFSWERQKDRLVDAVDAGLAACERPARGSSPGGR